MGGFEASKKKKKKFLIAGIPRKTIQSHIRQGHAQLTCQIDLANKVPILCLPWGIYPHWSSFIQVQNSHLMSTPAPSPTAAAATTTATIASSTFSVATPAPILRLVLLLLLHYLDDLFGDSKVFDLWGISTVCAVKGGGGGGSAPRANVRYFL